MNHIADNEVSPKTLIGIAKDMITLQGAGGYEYVDVEHYKPYLYPMSSMTEEQRKEFKDNFVTYHPYVTGGWYNIEYVNRFYAPIEVIDWLNKNHFDYRGLIEKGLAINATDLNIY